MIEQATIIQRAWDYLISLPWQFKILLIGVFILACIVMGIFTIRANKRDAKKAKVSNPERRYMRIQELGLAVFVSLPVAMMLAIRYGLDYAIPQISVLLLFIALIIFFIGLVGRQELKERNTGGK